ncbi:MAG: MopE-related protein, partial [Myxococcota bacterium]
MLRRLVLLSLLVACVPAEHTEDSVPPTGAIAGAKLGDADGDGDPDATDCDDADGTVHTGAEEACDAADDDCDGIVDEGACPCEDDTDGDHAFLFCTTPLTWTEAQAACASFGYHLADVEDASEEAWIWAAAESLGAGTGWWHGGNDRAVEGTFGWDGGADATWTHWRAGEPNDFGGAEDCAAFADDGGGAWNDKACTVAYPYVCEAGCVWRTWHEDADGDGFGDARTTIRACEPPAGAVADATDCDDGDPGVFPGGAEVCGGGDEDCDGAVDDADAGVAVDGRSRWHPDADGDGFGDAAVSVDACAAPAGHVADGGDCDDTDAAVAPGATERAGDGVDQDCDGEDGCTWFADVDGDGFGDAAAPHTECGRPTGYAAVAGDCDDSDARVFPGAPEIWYDGVDGDCAGGSDYDADGDGVLPGTYGGGDCDDLDPTVAPGGDETCDGVDEDCDGRIDEDACAVPVVERDGHAYLFVATRTDWESARSACAALGHHLVDLR